MHLCYTIPRIGPYHAARLNAAATAGRISVVETVRVESLYAWDEIKHAGPFQRETLFESNESDQSSKASIKTRMFEMLDKLNPDVVAITGWAMPDALAAISWATSRKVPAVLMSESQHRDEVRSAPKEFIKSQLVGLFSAGLVGGQPHLEYLSMLGMPKERIFMGYDVVDNQHFATKAGHARANKKLRTELGLPERYFLASNRFIPKKNLSTLLQAFSIYRKLAGPQACDLVLLGDGPMKAELQAQCVQLQITHCVHFPGFKQYEELPGFYAFADAFVHASTTEQWGLVINEAMSAGLPVIVSEACGAAKDLVGNGLNGFVFSPTAPQQFANFMHKISSDSKLRTQMGEASQEIISGWSPDLFAQNSWKAANIARAVRLPKVKISQRLILKAIS
ncbi:glycosyltransferase [Planctomicrobium sp. SH527]|uniref:glycosyltransferase n=1 Tax=Planctomicrobium sp. SH527 TaxID=3448123 RepID=UPI003F5C51E7